MAKKPARARTQRRIDERRLAHLVRDKERLARLEQGGSPERPIVVSSASVIETHARSMPCPQCDGALRVDEHAANEGLREVHVQCVTCGARRTLYFRMASAPN
jgi:hypothetical protein